MSATAQDDRMINVYRWGLTFRFAIAGIVIGMFLLICATTVAAWLASAPVSVVHTAASYDHDVHAGGVVSIDVVADKSRECVTETSRWLWRDTKDGRREVFELSYGAMGFGHDQPGVSRNYRFMFEVPLSTPLGEWNVRTLHADFCWPWSWTIGPRLRTSPPMGLRVLPPIDGAPR